MQSSFMAKRELKEDDWERRPSIRSGPFSFLGSGFAQIFKVWASRLLRVRTPSNTNSSNFYHGVYFLDSKTTVNRVK